MNYGSDFISEALGLPNDAIAYEVSRRLADAHPEMEMVQGCEGYFNLIEFGKAGQCHVEADDSVHGQTFVSYDGVEGIIREPQNAGFLVRWRGNRLQVVLVTFQSGMCRQTYYWILADSKELAEEFFLAACAWNAEIRDEVLVYDGGNWQKDKELFESIQGASFGDLILQESLKSQIREDLRRFIQSRSAYEKFRIPWKRGIVFIGPPGNGKTHCVKALVNELAIPCLYVKSLAAQYQTEQDCIREVFQRARKSVPCVLVFEDLDSLLTDSNRSFFLNELDGFADNAGLITIATTNHPDKLDSAIIDRPSRFDRKYHFTLPDTDLRREYLGFWNQRLDEEVRLAPEELASIAELTEGYSFAYLKELVSSSLIAWIGEPDRGRFAAVMATQSRLLREQMRSVAPSPNHHD